MSNFRATFGCVVKQLLLDLLAQSIHAYPGKDVSNFCLQKLGEKGSGGQTCRCYSKKRSDDPWIFLVFSIIDLQNLQ